MVGTDVIFGIISAVTPVVMALWRPIIKVRGQTKNFGPALAQLQRTMRLIAPMIEELDRMNRLHHHDKFTEDVIPLFIKLLEDGEKLVIKCEALPRWNKIKKYKYAKRLVELDSSICSLLDRAFQAAQIIRNSKEKINKKYD